MTRSCRELVGNLSRSPTQRAGGADQRLQSESQSSFGAVPAGAGRTAILPGGLLSHRDRRSIGRPDAILNNRPPHSSTFSGVTFNDFVLPLELTYEADVWGRVRRTVESYRDQAQASAADLAAVNLSMHANLAFDYFAARSLDAEEKLLQDTVVQYEHACN